MKKTKIILPLMVFISVLSACKKDADPTLPAEYTSATDQASTTMNATTAMVETTSATSVSSTEQTNVVNEETTATVETIAADLDLNNAFLPYECAPMTGDSFLTADYALYHDHHGRLQIFDVTTKKDLVYCFDPGCEHKPAKTGWNGEILEAGCIAYDISRFPVMIKGEHCYFLNDKNEVCVSDRQGQNRKVIARIPGYIINPYNVYFSENAIFVDYSTQYEMVEVKDSNGESRWNIGGTKQKLTGGVVSVDLNTGKVRELFRREDHSAYVAQGAVRGNYVFIGYSYNELPYVGPTGEANGFSLEEILNGKTLEEYRAELPKHTWTDIYVYNTTTGEIKLFMEHQQDFALFFGDDYYVYNKIGENGKFYRYNGEKKLELTFPVKGGFPTDRGFVCTDVTTPWDYWLTDTNTGEVVKKVTIPYALFHPSCFIGDSVYGLIGRTTAGYISAEDFWAGKTENAVKFTME